MHSPSGWEDKNTLKNVLPYLLETFNYKDIPWWFDPFTYLTSLIDLYNIHDPFSNPVCLFLSKSGIIEKFTLIFNECLARKRKDAGTLEVINKLVRFFASYSAFDEGGRYFLLENKSLLGYLEGSIQSHLATLKKFQEYLPTLLESTSSQNPLEIPQLYDSGSVLSLSLIHI